MKNLDLKQIGVKELSINEQKNVDGGWIFFAFLAVAFFGFIVGNAVGNSYDDCE